MAQVKIVIEWYRNAEGIGNDKLGPYIASSERDADRFIESYIYRYWPEAHIRVYSWPHPWLDIATNKQPMREYKDRVRQDHATSEPLF